MASEHDDLHGVRTRWLRFTNQLRGEPGFERYWRIADEPRDLFDLVGEDLGSPKEKVRRGAFWVLCLAMPELTDITHERETRHPGFRAASGDDAELLNRAMESLVEVHDHYIGRRRDLLTYLYDHLVVGGRFDPTLGKDPRPFIRTVAKRWRISERRREGRVVPLELDGDRSSPPIADPASRMPDEALETLLFEETCRELECWGCSLPEERSMFATVYGSDLPLQSAAARLGVSYPTLRQRLSRFRRRAIRTRDRRFLAVLQAELRVQGLLVEPPSVCPTIPTVASDVGATEAAALRHSSLWQRLVRSIEPGNWHPSYVALPDGRHQLWAVCPLTRSVGGEMPLLWIADPNAELNNEQAHEDFSWGFWGRPPARRKPDHYLAEKVVHSGEGVYLRTDRFIGVDPEAEPITGIVDLDWEFAWLWWVGSVCVFIPTFISPHLEPCSCSDMAQRALVRDFNRTISRHHQ